MPAYIKYLATYDLVASPGFKYATLKIENRLARINKIESIIKKLKRTFDNTK